MKKSIILLLVLVICLAGIANALNVGIVVKFPDSSVKTDCVSGATSGYDILQKSIFDVAWSEPGMFGRALCKIDGIGDEVSEFAGNCVWDPDLFWAFYILNGNSWEVAPVGAASYNAVDKDVIGFVRSGFDFTFAPTEEPPVKTYEQLCEKLNVKDIKVYVDGKKESGADENGGKIDVVPGSELKLKITVENLYDKDENVDIKDILIEGMLEDINHGNDLESDANEFNLNPEKDKEISLEFNIPLEVEDGNYDLIVEIEGENENGFPYFKTIEFEVEVNKEKHDVIFKKLKFLNDNVECSKSASLDVNIVNFGTNDESVKLTLSNNELGISIQESFELNENIFDKDNSFSKSYVINTPSNINPGTYTLFADLFYRNKIKSSTVELNVKCNVLKEENSKEIKSATNNPAKSKNNKPSESTIETTPTKIIGATTSTVTEGKKLSNKNILMAGIFFGEILVLIIGIVLFVHVSKRR